MLRAEQCPVPDGAYIRSLQFIGLDHTRLSVVDQELKQPPGARFSCIQWEAEKNRLKDLGIFAEVKLIAEGSMDTADLTIHFKELPPFLSLISAVYTDQDGLSVGPHLALTNFLGTAKKVHLLARFGGTTEYKAALAGRQLIGLPVEFEAAWVHVDSYNPFESFHENSHSFRVESIWPLGPTRRYGFVQVAEGFWIQSDSSSVLLNRGGDWIPRLGFGFRWDARDRALQPRKGVYADFRLTQNGGTLGGPSDYREWQGDLRGYLPITARQGLASSTLYQFRGGGPLGAYDRFHVGGVNSLRGYTRNAFQGRNECLLNGEYEFDILQEKIQRAWRWSVNYGIQAVAGIDIVGLWDEENLMADRFHSGYYVGLHALVPGVDRLRAELGNQGFSLDAQFHFGMFEKPNSQHWRTR